VKPLNRSELGADLSDYLMFLIKIPVRFNHLLGLMTFVVLCGCASQPLVIRGTKGETHLAASDSVAQSFVQANNLLHERSKYRMGRHWWGDMRYFFSSTMEKTLFREVDSYMTSDLPVPTVGPYWWFQRGVLYISGGAPWSCKLSRVKALPEGAVYRVDRIVHSERGSYMRCKPVYFTVKLINNESYRVTEIKYDDVPFGVPAQEGEKVSIRKVIAYAMSRRRTK
jgi:hypothetical protein